MRCDHGEHHRAVELTYCRRVAALAAMQRLVLLVVVIVLSIVAVRRVRSS